MRELVRKRAQRIGEFITPNVGLANRQFRLEASGQQGLGLLDGSLLRRVGAMATSSPTRAGKSSLAARNARSGSARTLMITPVMKSQAIRPVARSGGMVDVAIVPMAACETEEHSCADLAYSESETRSRALRKMTAAWLRSSADIASKSRFSFRFGRSSRIRRGLLPSFA